MIYEIKCLDMGTKKLLEHKEYYSEKEFHEIIANVKFELSHHVNSNDIIRILCDKYGFVRVYSVEI